MPEQEQRQGHDTDADDLAPGQSEASLVLAEEVEEEPACSVGDRTDNPYAPRTVQLTMTYASAVLRVAYVNGRIGRDPTLGLERPKDRDVRHKGKVGPDQVPTREEVLALLEGAPPRSRAAIAFGMAGLRVGEMLGMRRMKIHLDDCEVVIDTQAQFDSVNGLHLKLVKNEEARTIRMPSWLSDEVRRHLDAYVTGELLFPGPRSGDLLRRHQFYEQAWDPALEGAGLPPKRFVFHSLRHWCASSMLSAGVGEGDVAGHLGDTVQTVRDHYLHWLRDNRHIPADALERIYTGNGGTSRVLLGSDHV